MVSGISNNITMHQPINMVKGNINSSTSLVAGLEKLKNRLIADEKSIPNNLFINEIIDSLEEKFALLKASVNKANPSDAAALELFLNNAMADNDLVSSYNTLGALERKLALNA